MICSLLAAADPIKVDYLSEISNKKSLKLRATRSQTIKDLAV